jgi:ribosomal protein S18 acetylase RimI-like enzyme
VVGEVRLRPATEADVEVMAALQSEAYWSVIELLEPGSQDCPGYYERVIEKGHADAIAGWPTATIAELSNKPAGLCTLKYRRVTIDGLWVSPDLHRMGIGTLLLQDAIERLRRQGQEKAEISVHPLNPARRLYHRAGFQIARKTEQYSKGLDRFLPVWILHKAI